MDQDVTSLHDHVSILRRRWRIVVFCMVQGILIGLGLSFLQDPLYRAEALVLVEPQRVSSSPIVIAPDEVATQARVVASAPVAKRVIDTLGLEEKPEVLLRTVNAEVLEQTRTVAVTAARPSAAEAAAVANAFAAEYILYRTDAAARAARVAREALTAQQESLSGELASVRDQLDGPGLTGLNRQELKAQEEGLVSRLAEVLIEMRLADAEAPEGTSGGQVLREAQPPGAPAEPRPVRSAGFGGLVGLLVGMLLAYGRDRFDDGLRDEHRLLTALAGQPVLGRIPQEAGAGSRLVTLTHPNSAESEAYRTLTTNIRFLCSAHADRDDHGDLLVVTSAVAGEGKTTLAANIAVTAARVGLRVVLVDADLRDPSVMGRFGIDLPIGLSHVLAEQADVKKVLFDAQAIDLPGLAILPAGHIPPNPAELFAGPHALAVWTELRLLADLVVVDTAPVLNVADTLEIVGMADLTVLAARYKVSRVHRIQATIDQIRQVGGTVAGAAWCGIPIKDSVSGYGPDRPE